MKNEKYDKKQKTKLILKFNIFVRFLNFLLLLNLVKSQCQKNTPILINGQCKLQYCTEKQYENNTCKIANEIIANQWLTNIIRIGDLNYRYINFATYSKGDMIVETSACPGDAKRMFYGIDIDGRGLFNRESDFGRTNYFSIEVGPQPDNKNNYRYEAENFIVKISEGTDKGKEYLVSITKGSQYTELYNFENKNLEEKQTSKILGKEISNIRFPAISYIFNNINYILFGYKTTNGDNSFLYLVRLRFKNNKFTSDNPEKKEFKKDANICMSLSCFVTDSKYIICCYIDQDKITTYSPPNRPGGNQPPNIIIRKNFCMMALDEDENIIEKKTRCFSDDINSDLSIFLKCIHLKGEAGAFTYYDSSNYPIILFKNYKKEINNFDGYLDIPSIKLNKYK